jgi:hypothetical protein
MGGSGLGLFKVQLPNFRVGAKQDYETFSGTIDGLQASAKEGQSSILKLIRTMHLFTIIVACLRSEIRVKLERRWCLSVCLSVRPSICMFHLWNY